MALRFKHTSQSTCSDDGLWMAFTDDAHTVAVYEFAYWADMDSSAVPTYGKYNVVSGYVHLPDTSELFAVHAAASVSGSGTHFSSAQSALKTCGWEFVGARAGTAPFDDCNAWDVFCPHTGDVVARFADFDTWRYCVAEAMWMYGAKEVCCDVSGNNRRALIREARGEL